MQLRGLLYQHTEDEVVTAWTPRPPWVASSVGTLKEHVYAVHHRSIEDRIARYQTSVTMGDAKSLLQVRENIIRRISIWNKMNGSRFEPTCRFLYHSIACAIWRWSVFLKLKVTRNLFHNILNFLSNRELILQTLCTSFVLSYFIFCNHFYDDV
jgi:hypothetical protein